QMNVVEAFVTDPGADDRPLDPVADEMQDHAAVAEADHRIQQRPDTLREANRPRVDQGQWGFRPAQRTPCLGRRDVRREPVEIDAIGEEVDLALRAGLGFEPRDETWR